MSSLLAHGVPEVCPVSQQPIVRVVLGEAGEPHPGPVRWTLDIEGFDVVGQGSSRAELERVLAGVHPTVIVVDDAIPASALIALRAKAPDAGVVVVWPAGVSSKAIADAHVDPGCIEEDLARAVRRAAHRTTHTFSDPPVTVGEPVLILPDGEPVTTSARPVATSTAPRRRARVLVSTAAVMALIVMMVGVSFALEASRRAGPGDGTSTTHTPTPAPSIASSSPAGSGPVESGATGHDRQDCGPRVDPGSASSHAAQARPADGADRGTRSRGATCGGANAGGASNGGASKAGGATHGGANGSAGRGTGTEHPTNPTGHGNAGAHGGGKGQTRPDQTDTGDAPPVDHGRAHDEHGSSGSTKPATGH